ncbi:hypothetical protein D9753_06110 [Streptomyces dangxiongensis]|uniref:Chitin-binding type-4 domain-containing protein n=1 Tax=Streptomyces dangxiongensis TaxID=1442032 RepID=A0A3G2J8H6_9ACTN|nr:hypothetical protein D9753_06110 [Streptomyces dangxiongensis]
MSRRLLCADGAVKGCGEIQWEPQSVEGPKGFPADGPADGRLCSGGESHTFRRQFEARHAPYGGKQPPATLSHSGTLPTGLSGHHVILGVWTIADTGNAFYACSDVTFRRRTPSTPEATGAAGVGGLRPAGRSPVTVRRDGRSPERRRP